LRKMKKRIKFLHLYGPAIFDEALIDPILTMHRDLLPRFEVSDTVNKMVRRYLCCSSYCHRLYLSRCLIAELLSLRIIRLCVLQVVYHSLNSYPFSPISLTPIPYLFYPLTPTLLTTTLFNLYSLTITLLNLYSLTLSPLLGYACCKL
jgi:hypothetical protein